MPASFFAMLGISQRLGGLEVSATGTKVSPGIVFIFLLRQFLLLVNGQFV
jgi:hypothetical protein